MHWPDAPRPEAQPLPGAAYLTIGGTSNVWKGAGLGTVHSRPSAPSHGLAGAWTPDQVRVASRLPHCRRLCVPAANGVGKTHLAADLVVSFLADMPEALVIITAPTNRQVCDLLWPHISDRLRDQG